MKLLLTSGGLTNESIRTALRSLVGHTDIRIAFVPTAANVEKGDKDWLIHDLVNARKMGTVDIVDISAIDEAHWLPRLEHANVLLFGGGSTTHLIQCINRSGLDKQLPELLKTRVYVGISAGSMVLSKDLKASSGYLYGEKTEDAPAGLGYVPFYIRPHLNSSHFPKVTVENIRQLAEKFEDDVYVLDDNSAVRYVDGTIDVISEGTWKRFPE